MTRFQATGPRVTYKPVERDRPFKQIVGLYNMWQSLSPDTRKWIADLFTSKKSGEPTEDQTETASETMQLMNAGLDPQLFNIANDDNIVAIENPDDPALQNRSAAESWLDRIEIDNALDNAAKIAGVQPVVWRRSW